MCSVAGLAAALALLSAGCAASRPARPQQANACPHCSVMVAATLPLPVSSDQSIARLDQNWTVMAHECTCCPDAKSVFFAGSDFQDLCVAEASEAICCSNSASAPGVGLAQVER